MGAARNAPLGFWPNVDKNGYRFGFNVTVEADNVNAIKATTIKQEVFSLTAYGYGNNEWHYQLMDKNHPKNAKDDQGWNEPYKAWLKDSAVDWVTLDQDGKKKIDGTPEEIMKVYKASALSGKEFSWTDHPGINAKALETKDLEQVSMYKTFRITAKCAGEKEVAVFSVRQDITKRGGMWFPTADQGKYIRNGTWPQLPYTWPPSG